MWRIYFFYISSPNHPPLVPRLHSDAEPLHVTKLTTRREANRQHGIIVLVNLSHFPFVSPFLCSTVSLASHYARARLQQAMSMYHEWLSVNGSGSQRKTAVPIEQQKSVGLGDVPCLWFRSPRPIQPLASLVSNRLNHIIWRRRRRRRLRLFFGPTLIVHSDYMVDEAASMDTARLLRAGPST